MLSDDQRKKIHNKQNIEQEVTSTVAKIYPSNIQAILLEEPMRTTVQLNFHSIDHYKDQFIEHINRY